LRRCKRGSLSFAVHEISQRGGGANLRGKDLKRPVLALLRDRAGQVIAEYGVLMWFVTLIGVATLATFFFAFEEGVIGYYEDIVNVICLPIP